MDAAPTPPKQLRIRSRPQDAAPVRNGPQPLSIVAFVVERLLNAEAAGCRTCAPTFDPFALLRRVAALEAEHNAGRPFPPRKGA